MFHLSARAIHDQKAIAREMFAEQATHDNPDVSAIPLREETIVSIKSRGECTLDDLAEIVAARYQSREAGDSLLSLS